MTRNCRRRKASGSGLLALVAAISLLITLGGLLTLLLVCSGCGMIFQEQLERVNRLASSFASAHAQDSNVQGETESFVKDLMPQMGMAPLNLSVMVTSTQAQNGPSLRVTLTNQFPLAISHSVLPDHVTVSDSQTAGQL